LNFPVHQEIHRQVEAAEQRDEDQHRRQSDEQYRLAIPAHVAVAR
jgi:hypothetical protein